ITLAEIFQQPVIKKLAQLIQAASHHNGHVIAPVEKREYYPLSSAQKRLYTLQMMERENTVYNIPSAVILEGNIETQRLEETLLKLIRRHESLRTSIEFNRKEGDAVQRVQTCVEFKLETIETAGEPFQREPAEIVKAFIRPFDLTRPPLFRSGIVKLGKKRNLLIMDMHHIISDGASMGALVQEMMDIYSGRETPPPVIQYKEYSQWQLKQKQTEAHAAQQAYWLKEFEGQIPELNLP
ncbi:MAG: hypothetical protein GY765_08275, partial [bacterium]|nr:hypothetical protein [bacterium]